MSIRRMRTLLAIAERGTFAAAGEAVFISHAAVSMQMKSLEDELGVALFDRSKRPPTLTPVAHALLPRMRELVGAYEEMLRLATGGHEINGLLRLGAVPTTLVGLMPRAMRAFRDTHPSVHLHLAPGLSGDLLLQVERGQLDVAISSEPLHLPSRLRWEVFAEEPLVLLAPMDVSTDDPQRLLREHPFIRYNRRAWMGRIIDDWLQQQGIVVREAMELDSLEAIANMVYFHLGVSIVPHSCVPEPHPLPLNRLWLGSSAPPRRLGLLMRSDELGSSLVQALLAELRALVEAHRQQSRDTMVVPEAYRRDCAAHLAPLK